MIIALDEHLNLGFEIAALVVCFQQGTVLQDLLPAPNLTLRLLMERSTEHRAHMAHAMVFDVFRQFTCKVIRRWAFLALRKTPIICSSINRICVISPTVSQGPNSNYTWMNLRSHVRRRHRQRMSRGNFL